MPVSTSSLIYGIQNIRLVPAPRDQLLDECVYVCRTEAPARLLSSRKLGMTKWVFRLVLFSNELLLIAIRPRHP